MIHRVLKIGDQHIEAQSSDAEQLLQGWKEYVERAIEHLIPNHFGFQSIAEFSEFLSFPKDMES